VTQLTLAFGPDMQLRIEGCAADPREQPMDTVLLDQGHFRVDRPGVMIFHLSEEAGVPQSELYLDVAEHLELTCLDRAGEVVVTEPNDEPVRDHRQRLFHFAFPSAGLYIFTASNPELAFGGYR
jgi:hypothetical protein